jgi:uncharacterized membrane protein
MRSNVSYPTLKQSVMNRTRLEAFSDGVLAIIITIMVLEIRVPHGNDFTALKPLIPVLISYVLSFIYIGIYWNNHHHLMHTVKNVTGGILWANLHLLFWLSLVPFTTGWIGENHFDPIPMAVYGFVLLMAAIAFYVLQTIIVQSQGEHSILAKAIGSDLKGKMSLVLYLLAIGSNFTSQWISGSLYILVALIWLIPDKRIEIILKDEHESSHHKK